MANQSTVCPLSIIHCPLSIIHYPLLIAWLFIPSAVFADSTHRLQDGITAFVYNAEGRDFNLRLVVRDLNLYETGPRELLVKVYTPSGESVVRKVIPDDGVTSKAFLPPIGAWDHEAWYYAYCYGKGTQPMIRWSAFSAPDRLGSIAKREFTFPVKGGGKGVYRILIVGSVDHYVTWSTDPDLPSGISGHPDWIHGHGTAARKYFVYVPRGTFGLFAGFAEYDQPRKRKWTVRAPDGKELITDKPGQIFRQERVDFAKPGMYDDQLLMVEVSEGEGDYLLLLKLRLAKDPEVHFRGERFAPAIMTPDEKTAKAIQGGAIYHDNRVFWHPFQVRLHDWLAKLKPEDFEVRGADGKPALPFPEASAKDKKAVALPTQPGFLPLNGPYFAPPACDRILHHYPAHKNRAALNLAVKDLAAGLRSIGPNDHVSVAVGGSFANMAYEFGTYAWHYWRPAWRLLQQSDAPEDVKKIIREAFLVTGDRLSFCRTWERVNGNAFSQLLAALRYGYEATGDPLQKELFETYWQRFTTGGWGDRVGVGPSGPVQEGFAYAFHYGSYILTTWQAINADLKDPRFQKVHDGVHRWFSYTLADENIAAGPWSSRTHHYPHWKIETDGQFAWKGLPGPDFTESINNAQEWFAARRKNYYALTYHGRLSPKWESNAHPGQSGYGGGMLCQLQVPGKGPVLASTLNGNYGEGMDPSQWREFHLHTLAGIQADGTAFVSGDSEHPDAKLDKNKVGSSGEIRNTALRIQRSYQFEADGIAVSAQLQETLDEDLLGLWLKSNLRGKVKEAYEIIPFVGKQKVKPSGKQGNTEVQLLDANGKEMKPAAAEFVVASGVLLDRGGFGVKILLDKPRPIGLGTNSVIMIRLAEKVTPAKEVGLSYLIVPFGN